ncbi:hypothetical protein ABK040_001735 [Willaertia magna]
MLFCGSNVIGPILEKEDGIPGENISSPINTRNEKNLFNNIKKLKAGTDFIYILTYLNEIYYYNKQEQENWKKLEINYENKFYKYFKNIQIGEQHILIHSKEEKFTIFSVGKNSYGQLGLGDFEDRKKFTKIINPLNILQNNKIKIKAKLYNSIILNNLEIYICGRNDFGQIGQVDCKNYSSFIKITINNELNKFAMGLQHSLYFTKNNEIYSCGNNTFGQLGLNNSLHCKEFKLINLKLQKSNDKIINIKCAIYTSFIITNKSDIYVSGLFTGVKFQTVNSFTKITPNLNINDKIIKYFTKYFHHFFVTNNNDIYCIGINRNGQLGIGNCKTQNQFVKLNAFNSVINSIVCQDKFTIFYKITKSTKEIKLFKHKLFNQTLYFNSLSDIQFITK